MAYLLDANVFIQAKYQYYGFDICPGFWDWLQQSQIGQLVLSIDNVRDELLAREDDLATWVRNGGAKIFHPLDAPTLAHMTNLATWTTSRNYSQAAMNDFMSGADPFLVAYAKANRHTVVTHERPEPAAVRKIKIPDACIAIGVPYKSPFEMLRTNAACFTLQAHS